MIQTRRFVMTVAAVAILIAALALPAVSAHAAPASTTETSALDNLWQPLGDSLAHLQAGVLSLFATSKTDTELDTDAEIGRGADPNGMQADPDPGTRSTPTYEPYGGN